MSLFSAPWKLATGLAAFVSVLLGFFLFTSYVEKRHLTRQKNELIAKIEDPRTGYVARLTQANTNVVTLQAAVVTQNAKIREQAVVAEKDKKKLATLTVQLVAAQKETAAMQVRLNRFLATKPQGATLEARVRDIDARILEELKK